MTMKIVLVGRSNVGKSTLFRLLTGRKVPVGRRPGITTWAYEVKVGHVVYVDMPGYGFMKYKSQKSQEETKDYIVKYLEDRANENEILLAIEVIDAAAFLDIANRWDMRGEIPLEIELWDFLSDLKLDAVLAANKMDRIANPEETLDWITEKLGLTPPWRQWSTKIAPISAKRGEIGPLKDQIRRRISSPSSR